MVTPAFRAFLVGTLIAHPWMFAVATPFWVLAFTAPMMDPPTAPPRSGAVGGSR